LVFSSISFLFYFLPSTIALYFLAPHRLKNYVLLIASLIFYFWGAGAQIIILLLSIALNFCFSLFVGKGRREDNRQLISIGIGLSVITNIAILGYFKYANFFVAQLNIVGESLGMGVIAWDSVLLPIGISFYTFQIMSYVIDVARGQAKPLSNPLHFALYVSMFPQLIAGPIVRYHLVADQLLERTTRLDDFAIGAQRFALGLVKKVIIADSVAQIANAAFDAPSGELSMTAAWLGLIAYTLQIYFDFSAYSDMAIGLGRILGFRFPENFNRPYSAMSITDFWRRWHLTLSNWFRDYVYIPLGGSRAGTLRTYGNLWLVFLITGVWHGANWTFILWGLYHGALLVLERRLGRRTQISQSKVLSRISALILVMLGWVIFRAENVEAAAAYYQSLFWANTIFDISSLGDTLSNKNMLTLIAASIVFLLPTSFNAWRILETEKDSFFTSCFRYTTNIVAFPYALILVISGAFTAFIYFQF